MPEINFFNIGHSVCGAGYIWQGRRSQRWGAAACRVSLLTQSHDWGAFTLSSFSTNTEARQLGYARGPCLRATLVYPERPAASVVFQRFEYSYYCFRVVISKSLITCIKMSHNKTNYISIVKHGGQTHYHSAIRLVSPSLILQSHLMIYSVYLYWHLLSAVFWAMRQSLEQWLYYSSGGQEHSPILLTQAPATSFTGLCLIWAS